MTLPPHPLGTETLGAPASRRGIQRVLVPLVLAGLLLSASAAWADLWYVHYENAERALAQGRWREAVGQLNQALERKADSGLRVRSYGMKVVDYFPYLKLGIAYHQLGEEKAALEAFDTEERLGVVKGSPEAGRELARYRQLAQAARPAPAPEAPSAQAARDRTEEGVRSSLAEARRLEEEGKVDEAMKALAPALAVEPQPREAADLMARLSARAVAEEQARREAATLRTRLEQAKGLLAQGDAPGAASLLRQLLAAGPNEEARRLLESAQAAIVASVAARERSGRIAEALGEARRLQAAGQLPEALDRLETVLALDPVSSEAKTLRIQLMAARRRSEQGALARETLQAASGHFAAGRFEEALSAANRVLALERGNPEALGVVRRAYAQISRRLLDATGRPGSAGSGSVNLPPAIRFADLRQDVEGERIELAASPDFRLTGIAIDRSPVTVAFLDARGRPLAGGSRSQAVGDTYVTELSLPLRLRAGDTTITVVATDAEGLSSRSEYAVRYRRPWYLSPWLYASGALGAGAVAALLLQRRRSRRRRRRERRFNPYVAGGPIFDEALFYGREPLVQRILQTVHNNSLLLFGERRIGKTSLLHQVQRRLEVLDDPEYQFQAVYIDLQGTPEERLFATLADPIHEAVQAAGFGAEIAATAAEQTGCRIKRLGAPRIPVGYAPVLEQQSRVGPEAICAAVRAML